MKPTTRTATFLTAACLAGALSAQANIAVFPGDHTGTAPNLTLQGSTYQQQFPFSNGISRQMMVYETWDLGVPNGKRITHVGFPREQSITSFGKDVVLEIYMGATTRTAETADRDYARNYNSTPVLVFSRKPFKLPDLGIVTSPPVVDEVWVPLDTPYTIDTTQNLVVEYIVYANSNGNASFRYYLDMATFLSPITTFGQSCQNSGGKLPKLESQPSYIGGNWYIYLTNGPASSNISLNIGSLFTPPLDLGLIGAPGCFGYINPLAQIAGSTSTGGTLYLNFPVPNTLGLYKRKLASQALMIDFFANRAGLISSNGDKVQFGVKPRQTLITSTGNVAATTGSVYKNWGAMSLFGWQ